MAKNKDDADKAAKKAARKARNGQGAISAEAAAGPGQ